MHYSLYLIYIVEKKIPNLSFKTASEYFLARKFNDHINRLVQERRNSSALAMDLRISCTKPSAYAKWNGDILLTDSIFKELFIAG